MSLASEVRKLERQARRLGFKIEKLRSNHSRWIAPDGEVQVMPNTPGSGTTERAIKRWLRRFQDA